MTLRFWKGWNRYESIDEQLLESIADLHGTPAGAYNIRKNGAGVARQSSANIEIIPKQDKPGIDIIVKPHTKNESVHIPVLLQIRHQRHGLQPF